MTTGGEQQVSGEARGSGVLTPMDWRRLASESEPGAATVASTRAPRRIVADKLFLRSRRAGLAEERERAQQVVEVARSAVVSAFSDIRFGRKINRAELEPVVAAIAASVARSPTALPSVTRLKSRHEYTYLHSVAVCGLMVALGRELNLDPELTREIGLAGLLHDIGKAWIPTELLDKPGPLDFEEYALIQRHTSRGYEMLRDAGIDSEIALDVCLHHHERMDGGGYPSGISAQTISIHARMGAVCDVFDAVTSTRSYKESWSPGAALDWMGETVGQFDPKVLRAFRKMIGAFPIGSLVRLQSQRLAVVVDDPADDPLSPDVCLVLSADTGRELPPARISTRHDPIVGLEQSNQWDLPDWDKRLPDILKSFSRA